MTTQERAQQKVLESVFDYLNKKASYEPIYARVRAADPNIESFVDNLRNKDESLRDEWIKGLARNEIETILMGLLQFFDSHTAATVIPLIRMRYRRYVFRIIYVLWQDYYDKSEFRNLFLYALNHPKSVRYAAETRFTTDQLRSIALSSSVDRMLIELARKENRNMPEFLAYHKIRRDSVLAIDVASIVFLFCSAEEYLEFGSERLLIAIMRLETANRAKILNNMVKKLNPEQRKELKEVFIYFLYTYFDKDKSPKDYFWNYIIPEVRETVWDEFMHWRLRYGDNGPV
jgi:hypothetical protein